MQIELIWILSIGGSARHATDETPLTKKAKSKKLLLAFHEILRTWILRKSLTATLSRQEHR